MGSILLMAAHQSLLAHHTWQQDLGGTLLICGAMLASSVFEAVVSRIRKG